MSIELNNIKALHEIVEELYLSHVFLERDHQKLNSLVNKYGVSARALKELQYLKCRSFDDNSLFVNEIKKSFDYDTEEEQEIAHTFMYNFVTLEKSIEEYEDKIFKLEEELGNLKYVQDLTYHKIAPEIHSQYESEYGKLSHY